MKLLKMLPSIITLGNLLCGFLAIAYISDGYLIPAAWFIFLGMICDMLDGKVARLTKGCSDFGEQLDSLSDMVTFGVAPAFLTQSFIVQNSSCFSPFVGWLLCLPFVLCAACRLARFNVETEQDESSHLYFKGLATPAAAGVLASLILCSQFLTQYLPMHYYQVIVAMNAILLSVLMVSNIPYIHMGIQLLKNKRPVYILSILLFLIVMIGFKLNLLVTIIMIAFTSYAYASPIVCLFQNDEKETVPNSESI